jgi:hypothetical protein
MAERAAHALPRLFDPMEEDDAPTRVRSSDLPDDLDGNELPDIFELARREASGIDEHVNVIVDLSDDEDDDEDGKGTLISLLAVPPSAATLAKARCDEDASLSGLIDASSVVGRVAHAQEAAPARPRAGLSANARALMLASRLEAVSLTTRIAFVLSAAVVSAVLTLLVR